MTNLRVFGHGLLVGKQDVLIFWDSPKMWVVTWVLRVVTMASMWILLGRLLGSQELVHFLLIGQTVFIGVQSSGFVVASSVWDRFDATYPHLVISPTSLVPAMMGRTSVWMLNGVATSLVSFAVLVPLFDLRLPPVAFVVAPLLIVLTCVSAYGFFLFLGSFVVRAPQLRNLVHNLASILIMAISGVMVPLTFWPEPVQALARLLPLTHGLTAMRAIVGGSYGRGAGQEILLELLVGVSWLLLGMFAVDRMADLGRRDGSIEHY